MNNLHWPTVQQLLYEPGTGVGGGSFWTYEFYIKSPTVYARSDSALTVQLQQKSGLVFTTAEFADVLSTHGFTSQSLVSFPYFHVSELTYSFLNPATRSQTLMPYVLTEMKTSK